eukprot:6052327-Pyramimonas_sp.AAC.1
MDIGWNPIKATEWARPLPDGQLQAWTIPSGTDSDYTQDRERIARLSDVVSDMRRLYWQQAPKHEYGQDLVPAADASRVRREQKRLHDEGASGSAALNPTVTTGGQWTIMRRQREGYLVQSKLCPRCLVKE